MRKSALTAKIDAVIDEFSNDIDSLKSKLSSIEQEVEESNKMHEERLAEKTSVIQ